MTAALARRHPRQQWSPCVPAPATPASATIRSSFHPRCACLACRRLAASCGASLCDLRWLASAMAFLSTANHRSPICLLIARSYMHFMLVVLLINHLPALRVPGTHLKCHLLTQQSRACPAPTLASPTVAWPALPFSSQHQPRLLHQHHLLHTASARMCHHHHAVSTDLR